MKKKKKRRQGVFQMLLAGGLLYPSLLLAAGSSTSFNLDTSVISGGGGGMTSGSFSSNATIGQPTPIMDQDDIPVPPGSTNFASYPGYWYTVDGEAGCAGVAAFALCYGLSSADPGYNRGCDFDKDNDIDGSDLAELMLSL
ncbi:MAG: hypothetical protein KKC76_18760 [Proteobacteria bacterium]|nr:hypothetical protein [Pseudomonadota bacterium]MBU4295250.1 hypothetical protein [Pseudomonadota bacterium]MCG2750186.1 hypothetical protein [Desulfobulbaceae bacterium]